MTGALLWSLGSLGTHAPPPSAHRGAGMTDSRPAPPLLGWDLLLRFCVLYTFRPCSRAALHILLRWTLFPTGVLCSVTPGCPQTPACRCGAPALHCWRTSGLVPGWSLLLCSAPWPTSKDLSNLRSHRPLICGHCALRHSTEQDSVKPAYAKLLFL